MSYMVEIDEAACLAHGDCTDIAPDAFELDEVVRVVGTAPDDVLLEAAESCPSTAIRILDGATREQIYP